MKVPISDHAVINLDAPVLSAYEVVLDGSTHWIVWCVHCGEWHKHEPAEGHSEAHCQDSTSPYRKEGYNLTYAGKWKAPKEDASGEGVS